MTSQTFRTQDRHGLVRLIAIGLGTIALAFASMVLVACAGDASGGQSENKRLLDGLPTYPSATLVLEYEIGDGEDATLVREYAVEAGPSEAADAVTVFYRDHLVDEGWQEEDARAAFSGFSKDDSQLVLGRVGPEMQQAPEEAEVSFETDAPENAGFYFTLEVTSR